MLDPRLRGSPRRRRDGLSDGSGTRDARDELAHMNADVLDDGTTLRP